MKIVRTFLAMFFALVLLLPGRLMACAACFGQSDDKMAKGFNWGIFSLLAVVGLVLGVISSFFVVIARRAATVNGETELNPPAPHEPGDSQI